jgi:hypothetical protein
LDAPRVAGRYGDSRRHRLLRKDYLNAFDLLEVTSIDWRLRTTGSAAPYWGAACRVCGAGPLNLFGKVAPNLASNHNIPPKQRAHTPCVPNSTVEK